MNPTDKIGPIRAPHLLGRPGAERWSRARRAATRVGVALVLMVMAVSPLGAARAAGVDDAQRELDKINQQIQEKQNKLQDVRIRKTRVKADLRRISTQLERTSRELTSLRRQIAATEADIRKAQADLAVAEGDLVKRRGYIDTRVRALYERGSVSYVEVLLGSRDFGDFLNRMEMLRQIIAKDVAVYGQIKETRRQVADKKATLEAQEARLAGLKKQTEVKKASLDSSETQRQKALSELAGLENGLEEDLDELERSSNELRDFIRQNAGGSGLATDRSQINLAWPVSGGRITSVFGRRFHPILRKWKTHTGVDVGVAAWTPIKAAEDGRVILAEYRGGYGWTTMIDHGAGVVTLYAHAQRKLLTQEGDMVKKGQQIAYVGSSGYSTGAHAHFEVRINGEPVDPMGWLPKR